MYIVLEGMDKAGKSTIAGQIVKAMSELGMKVVHVHEPYKHAGMEGLREYVVDNRHSTYSRGVAALASRIELFKKIIQPALRDGAIVISERNFVSSLVYQGGDNPEPLLKIHQCAFEQFKLDMYPDVLVKLEVDHSTFLERLNTVGGPEDSIEHSLQAKGVFDALASRYDNAIKLATEGTKTRVIGLSELSQVINFM